MNADIGKILAVVIPVCLSAGLTIITIVFKSMSNRSRNILPACKELFEKIDTEISGMKKASTDRQNSYAAIQAQLELMVKSKEETREDIERLSQSVQQQAISMAKFDQQLEYIKNSLGKILEEIEGKKWGKK